MYACVFIFARICFLVFPLQICLSLDCKLVLEIIRKLQTRIVSNNPPNFKNKGRNYFNAITGTRYSVRRIRTSITK